MSTTTELWGLLLIFVFNNFPVYSNTHLLMNSYPYFWWFKSWVHVRHDTTPSKYHKVSQWTVVWRKITAWYLYEKHTEQFVAPPWGFQSFCGTGIVRVKLLSQKSCISEWLSWTKEVQLKDCDWGDTIFCPITFDFHLLVVILVSMSSEPQESFTKDLPFKAISFIHCG